jgi:hypothetical protein
MVVAGLALLPACAGSDGAALDEGTPIVLDTVPPDGATDVGADLSRITVTFSESMRPEGWSWVTEAGRSAPAITGFPFYVDELTHVLPVRLEPETAYVLWVNSPDDAALRKFESSTGITAPAHRIRFTTAPSAGGD